MVNFTTFVVWVHLVAVVLWIGGLFAVSFVCIPLIRSELESKRESAHLAAKVIARFQRVSREIIFIIFLTGIFNLINSGVARSFRFSDDYIGALVLKIILFVCIILVQAWQSTKLAPALLAIASNDDETASTEDALKQLQRPALLAAIMVVVFGATAILMGLTLYR